MHHSFFNYHNVVKRPAVVEEYFEHASPQLRSAGGLELEQHWQAHKLVVL